MTRKSSDDFPDEMKKVEEDGIFVTGQIACDEVGVT